ncbi:hypothetical protein BN961_01787 [Afipia felis]|uniref:Uncharacterized protein n=1 Tax=Afipia felis TaxID=1035 RepID=A0A090MQ89_AFIFE|nr:hypothetical protein BN961_01787 [Afipia felis]
MNSGLGDERTFADIRRMLVGHAVQDIVERARNLRECGELRIRHADLERIDEWLFQFQRRNQRAQIGVAATLAEAVQRTLDLAHARAHRRERIRNRLPGIVMRMDAEMRAGDVLRHLADDRLNLIRHGAAVGVAQHHPARAGLIGGLGTCQREFRVFLVAIEEMLAIEHGLAAFLRRRAHAVADRGEVFLLGRLKRDPHLIGGGFRHETERIGLRLQHADQSGVVRRRTARAAHHAERGELRVGKFRMGAEEFAVRRVRARITALDIIEAEIVKHLRDHALVVQREIDPAGLRAVAQRGVEKIESFAAHDANLIVEVLDYPRAACRRVLWSWWCWRAIRRQWKSNCAAGRDSHGPRKTPARNRWHRRS